MFGLIKVFSTSKEAAMQNATVSVVKKSQIFLTRLNLELLLKILNTIQMRLEFALSITMIRVLQTILVFVIPWNT